LHEATTDTAQVEAWWAENPDYNIGMVPGLSGCAVVDLDPPNGEENWRALQKEHGAAPETYAVRTPRGGLHLYFAGDLPPTTGNQKRGLADHIDTRGGGSYVLVPPSRTADGEYSEVVGSSGEAQRIALLPKWVPAMLAAQRAHVKTAAPADIDEDLPGNVMRAQKWLGQQEALVEGEHSDERTFVLACKLREFGVSHEKAVELLAAFQPAFTDEWVADKVANAWRYAENAPAIHAAQPAAETFKSPPSEAKPEPAAANDGPVDFDTVFAAPVEPVREVIAGLVERGILNLLVAPGSHYKSTVGLQWGLCVAAGMPVWGRQVERCTFLHLSYEDDQNEVNRRGQKIRTLLQLPAGTPALCWDLRAHPLGALLAIAENEVVELPFWRRLRTWLKATPGHKFILADSAYDILVFQQGARVNEDRVREAIRKLDALCAECDATMVALYHPTRAGAARGDAGNSPAWDNTPRSRLSLKRLEGAKDAVTLTVDKRNHGPEGEQITLRYAGGVMIPEAPRSARQIDQLTASVVRVALSAAKEGLPISRRGRLSSWFLDEIQNETGRKPMERTVRDTLEQACHDGLLAWRGNSGGRNRRLAGYYPPGTEGQEAEGEPS